MKTIGVTGANGQVGSALKRISSSDTTNNWYFYERGQWDIVKIDTFPTTKKFDVIINCAAYTAVDKAESEASLAFEINATALKNLSAYANESHCLLIHISSDYVYHNQQNRPLLETDPCIPKGVYARSKWEGEEIIKNNCNNYLILRTSWVYGIEGSNFVKTIVRLSETKDSISVVDDQIGTPTFADDISNCILALIRKTNDFRVNPVKLTLNFSNQGVCSWYDFAYRIIELTNKKIQIEPINTSQYPTPAQRPSYSVLDKKSIIHYLGDSYVNRHWNEALIDYFNKII